ncbi:MAG: DivIVA domain-containing protein [Longimicrobiales bacterium]
MIDLTPLDVRKKRGDFTKALRGYAAEEVDAFLELVSERMEELVKENLQLSERTERLAEQVSAQEGRENAVQEALVTAQALREDVKQQAHREAELTQREAKTAVDQMVAEAERMLDERKQSLGDLERHRLRFLKSFRSLLERELDTVEVEEGRTPLEDVELEIDLGGVSEPAEDAEASDADASGDEEAPAEEIAEVVVEADDDVAEPAEAVPAPDEEPKAAADDDDDSLWLDALLDGESQDEGRWS